ncbi:MAG: lysophospholipid acyltransferase family protein [Candidatus Omnitrophica bacterium]|nr:lysophospholipid acyltransferase family protein [Candidatus Omnitrophota bacterium]MCM8790544.1 lysophospholipid acyltransferase family protein [Candidatus Omnitrophota bacterium]
MKFKYRRYYLYYLGRCVAFLFYILPMRVSLRIAALCGRMAFLLLGKYRQITIDNLKMAFGGEKSDAEIRKIALAVFEHLGKTAAELINFPKINESNIDRFVHIRNLEIIDAALAAGKGVITLTAHLGNWELLALTLRLKGYSGVAIGRKIYFEKYDKYLNSLRRIHDVNVLDRDQSPRAFLKILRANRILGILADQDVDSVEGVFVNFFGQPAYTPVGPVALAKASGAALIPAFLVRQGRRHEFFIEKPIELVDTADRQADMVTNTQKWSDVVESYVRRYPDQWVWLHRRWKTKPSKETM